MSEGMRVAPRWRAERIGTINDIECFVPGEEPGDPRAGDAGEAPEEPVTMMEYYASITYRNPVPENAERAVAAGHREASARSAVPGVRPHLRRRARLLPHRLGGAHRGARRRPPAARRRQQLHDRHAGAVPGPDRDRAVRPGVRPPRRRRRRPRLPGAHRRARRRHPPGHPRRRDVGVGGGARRDARGHRGAIGGLVGWIPTGEPDDTNPDLLDKVL